MADTNTGTIIHFCRQCYIVIFFGSMITNSLSHFGK